MSAHVDAERLRDLWAVLTDFERHCPCGARPESPATHPHVGGCPVYEALYITLPATIDELGALRKIAEAVTPLRNSSRRRTLKGEERVVLRPHLMEALIGSHNAWLATYPAETATP